MRLFSAPSAPAPPPIVIPEPPPAPAVGAPAAEPVLKREDPAVQAARDRELEVARRMKGRSSTILTGALGDTSDAPVYRPKLLGA